MGFLESVGTERHKRRVVGRREQSKAPVKPRNCYSWQNFAFRTSVSLIALCRASDGNVAELSELVVQCSEYGGLTRSSRQ